jgi:hypothetical protein
MHSISLPIVEHVIALADEAKGTEDASQLETYINELTKEQQAELQALMWYGRDDNEDDPIPFAEYLEFSNTNLDSVATYMGEKIVQLPDYLREGLRLVAERNEAWTSDD